MKTMTKFLAVFFVITCFVACGPTTQDAIKYHNAIYEQHKLINDQGTIFSESIDNIDMDKGDFTQVDTEYAKLSKQIDASIEITNKMEAFAGSSDYKNEALKYFKTYQNMVANEFKEMITILKKPKADFKEADLKKIEELGKKVSEDEKVAQENFGKAQSAFATKWKFELK